MSEAVPSEPETKAPEPSTLPRDAAPVLRLARRDGGIALAGLSAFAATDAWYAVTHLPLAALLSMAVAVVVGIGLATRAHEWGHFAGARLAGGIAPTRDDRSLFPIFDLDLKRSDPRAFRAMSVGGNLGHWGLFIALLAALPLDAPGRAALVAASFGFAVSASVTEFPIIARAYSGVPPIECFRGLTGAKLRRDRWIGAAAGLVLFAIL